MFVLLASVVAFSQFTFAQEEVAPGVLKVGFIENPVITESSGIIPSRKRRDTFWTHNDGGLDVVYAISREGAPLGEWKIKDVDLDNIEDIATGPGGLYVADIGNNTGERNEVRVVRIPEPNPIRSGEVRPRRIWTLTYPDDAFDAESFFILKSRGYILSRELSNGEARLYRFPLNKRGATFELEGLCKFNVDDEPRGADVTADGRRVAVITSSGAYLFTFDKTGFPIDGIVEPTLFVPFSDNSMEGCTFTTEGLLVSSEGRNIYLFTDAAFQLPSKGRRR
ncbi:MAG TPA: hypothetical protein VK530_06405 [Candidatus Acidoferrum sp.]|nr:hypothetical protein [Candidatus Acidoferrum sp.]